MVRKIQEYFKDMKLAERVFTLIALFLLVVTAMIWFVGTRVNHRNQSQVVTSSKPLEEDYEEIAENAVKDLEKSNTDENLLLAQKAVDNLLDNSKKAELQQRIDTVSVAMKKKAEEIQKAKLKAELVRAEAAKKLAEEQKNSETSADSTEAVAEGESIVGGTEGYQDFSNSYEYVEEDSSTVYTPSSSSTTTTQIPSSSSVTEVVPPSSSEIVVPSIPEPVEPSSSIEMEEPVDFSTSTEDLSQR